MEQNYLSHMRNSAHECFEVIKHAVPLEKTSTGTPAAAFYPHVNLLNAVTRLLAIPLIKWEEGYTSFVNDISRDNEALDSWCKMIALFTSNLPGDYKKEVADVIQRMFNEYSAISPGLEKSFRLEKETSMSDALAYMLCVVSSAYVENSYGK